MNGADLFAIDHQTFKEILKSFDKTEQTLIEDTTTLREWMKTQPHLPEIMDENRIQNFLILNKFSIERTKEKIDMYYTIRSLIPDMFENVNPECPNVEKVRKFMYWTPVLKLTKEMYRVFFHKMRNKNMADEMKPQDVIAHGFNVQEIRLKEDRMFGDIMIFDLEDVPWTYYTKLTPTLLAKAVAVYQKVYSARVKAAYIVNSLPLIGAVLTVLKSLLKPKIFKRIHVYKDSSILKELFPKEMLPKDYGGEEKSLEKLKELLTLKFVENKDRFDQLDKMRVNEALRPEKLKNDEILGFHGNFKKLNVD